MDGSDPSPTVELVAAPPPNFDKSERFPRNRKKIEQEGVSFSQDDTMN